MSYRDYYLNNVHKTINTINKAGQGIHDIFHGKDSFGEKGLSEQNKTDFANVFKDLSNAMIQVSETNARAAREQWGAQMAMMDKQMAFNASEAQKGRDFSQAQFDQSLGFNASQAQAANQFTEDMWNKSAEYNLMNSREAREWSANQAELQRSWLERMDNTAVERRMADLKRSGINPILASGMTAGVGSAAVGSTNAPTMNSASGVSASVSSGSAPTASGGLGSASIENTSNSLATFGAMASAMGTALEAFQKLGKSKTGQNLIKNLFK